MRAWSVLFLVCVVGCSTKATGTGTSSSSGSTGSSGASSSGGTSGGSDTSSSSGTSGTGSSSGTSGSGSSSGSDFCAAHVTLVGPKWSQSCSDWLDANCCTEEKVCSDDPQCLGLVACIDSCNGDDACINSSCTGYPQSASDGIQAIGACTKQPGATIPSTCQWPN